MKVFVYGTLQRGRGNNHVLGDAVFLGKAVTVRKFGMVDVGFPFALPNQKLAPVAGELFDIGDDEHTLMRLDRLEAEGRMYDRVKRMVVIDGKRRFASMYVKHGDGRPCGVPVPVNARGHLEWRAA